MLTTFTASTQQLVIYCPPAIRHWIGGPSMYVFCMSPYIWASPWDDYKLHLHQCTFICKIDSNVLCERSLDLVIYSICVCPCVHQYIGHNWYIFIESSQYQIYFFRYIISWWANFWSRFLHGPPSGRNFSQVSQQQQNRSPIHSSTKVYQLFLTNYKNLSQVWRWDRKIHPRIAVWHHKACRVMANSDFNIWFFLFHHRTINWLFFLLTI